MKAVQVSKPGGTLDLVEREIGAHAAHHFARDIEPAVAQQTEHAGELWSEPGLEIDHTLTRTLAHNRAETVTAAHFEACKFHSNFRALPRLHTAAWSRARFGDMLRG